MKGDAMKGDDMTGDDMTGAESLSASALTLQTYREKAALYLDHTPKAVSDSLKLWLDMMVDSLSPEARILELGSGSGRDASYLGSLGFSVQCTDAADSFVEHLKARALPARLLNVLTDELTDEYSTGWDLIFADAVFLHFSLEEFRLALSKCHRALATGGRLAFTVKDGDGECWSEDRLDAPRFFRYWRADQIRLELERAGFSVFDVSTHNAPTGDWVHAIAQK